MISSSFLEIISIVVLLDFVNFYNYESHNRVGVVTKVFEILNINFD